LDDDGDVDSSVLDRSSNPGIIPVKSGGAGNDDDDDDGSEIQPVVAKGAGSSFMEGEVLDSGIESLKELNDSEIPLVAVKGGAPAAEEEPVKKERKPSAAGCVAGVFTSEGKRGYQEDRYEMDDKNALYGVFDGHGGDKASHYLEKHMKEYVMNELDTVPDAAGDDKYENALKQAFIKIDEKFLEKLCDDGSTACLGYVAPNGKLYVANAGDTRAIVVCADHSVVEMSKDHKPDVPEERKRIDAALHEVNIITDVYKGKRIKIARVDGMLAVARAIGDGSLKDMKDPAENAVTCVPEVRNIAVDPAKHRFLVIACDGIWDVYSNQEVADIVMKELGELKKPIASDVLSHTAEIIVNTAIEKGSMDNCTVVIVAL